LIINQFEKLFTESFFQFNHKINTLHLHSPWNHGLRY